MSRRRPPRRGPPAASRRAPRSRSAREVALEVLGRVRATGAYSNLALPAAIRRAGLDRRDAALAAELCYGTLRMQGALDWVLSLHSDRPLPRLDPEVLDTLRLGAYQLLYLDVPPYAAVSETVSVAPEKGAKYVNAVLRKLSAGKETIPWPSREGDLESYLRIRHSHPGWLVRLWLSELGPERTEALCRANNVFEGVGIRVNRLKTNPDDLAARLGEAGIEAEPGRWSQDALLVREGGAPASWPGWEEGQFAVQDEASLLVVEALAPRNDETVVDICAGPGGKSAHIAALARALIALELNEGRARLVAQTLERLGSSARHLVVRADGRHPPLGPGADLVLLDAPCSGLGVLRRRPESRWRVGPEDVAALAGLQGALLDAAWGLLREGGRLVYSVCTLTRAETTHVIEGFGGRHPEAIRLAVLEELPRPGSGPELQLSPDLHGTDGMFIAKLRKP